MGKKKGARTHHYYMSITSTGHANPKEIEKIIKAGLKAVGKPSETVQVERVVWNGLYDYFI